VLLDFLNGCEAAAKPPPPPPPKVSAASFARRGVQIGSEQWPPLLSNFELQSHLKWHRHPKTLADVLTWGAVPFESTERLGDSRPDRINLLLSWLKRMPAFKWLERQLPIKDALASFGRVQKRRKHDEKFSDDLAIFRFWLLAAWAAVMLGARIKPQPTAEQRLQAISAAKKLRTLARDTKLLVTAQIGYPEQNVFLSVLDQLQALAEIQRRTRTDAFSGDRSYIRSLTSCAIESFNDAPPALICSLAAMKVKNPDKASITRQVTDFKKTRALERDTVTRAP
jgi:hypothetical protein